MKFLNSQTHIAKHNGRSHKPTLKPKPAIELVYLPTQTLPTLKKLNLFKTEKKGMTDIINNLKPLTDKNAQLVTKAICNKGFSGNSSVLPRSNFAVGGQDSSPQSLTAYSLSRYSQW